MPQPMLDVHVHLIVDEAYELLANWDALAGAAGCAHQAARASGPVELSLVVTSADAIQALNRQFAGEDAPTDVLSFPAADDPTATEPGEPRYLGDVIIAYPVAAAQAAQAGHTVEDEMRLLAIHGVLHLLGYDHDTPEREAEIQALQSAALDVLREE